MKELKNWTEVCPWYYRYVVSANVTYEIFIEYWDEETPIETAKASLCIVENCTLKNEKSIVKREWLKKELPIQELLDIAYKDDKENKMINIAALLKSCPKGMEFDCTICNGVKFIELDRNPNFPIVVRANNGYEFTLTKYGQVHNIDDAKCVIFPKGKTSWKEFVIPFKVGDWIYHNKSGNAFHINKIENDLYISDDLATISLGRQNEWRLWTIQDAKDGDVLYYKSPLTNIEYIVMSKGINGYGTIDSYFRYNTEFGFGINIPSVLNSEQNITPATKEQRDLLFTKMKEAGYEWDFEKKELKKIEQVELPKGEDYGIDGLYHAASILEKTLGDVEGYQSDDGILEHKCAIEAVKRLYNQKSAWSEDDMETIDRIYNFIWKNRKGDTSEIYQQEKDANWLKSLKERMKGE